MYQFSYAEVLDETPKTARERERMAIDHSIDLLRAAQESGPTSQDAIEAAHYVRKLWGIFIEDLAKTENDLPKPLRAELISVGLWLMREAEQLRLEKPVSLDSMIEVSAAIRDGLH